MKKRQKKKYIPKNTLFCSGCKYYVNNGEQILTREKGCKFADVCTSNCLGLQKKACTYYDCKCLYLNYTDKDGETSLIDGVKICNVSMGLNK